jgi:hypothetical protein
MLTKGQEPDNAYYNFACVYSLSSAAVLADLELQDSDRRRTADNYAQRAVEMLRRIRAGLTADLVSYMKTDSDLKPLRDRDDFKRLLEELDRAAEPSKSEIR